MPKRPKLLMEERRRAILDAVDTTGRVKVEELSKRFGVSSVTVREDLEALSAKGALVRSYGGAIPALNPLQDYAPNYKKKVHHAEKIRIAEAAARLVMPNQTVILDSGTTTTELAGQLKRLAPQGLTVITHSLDIATCLEDATQISVIMIGGLLRHISHSFVGPQAERALQELYADHFFLAVDGVDLETGLSTPDILEAQLNARMIGISRATTVIADASKFGRRSVSVIGALDCVQRVITDGRLSEERVGQIRKRGIEVVLV